MLKCPDIFFLNQITLFFFLKHVRKNLKLEIILFVKLILEDSLKDQNYYQMKMNHFGLIFEVGIFYSILILKAKGLTLFIYSSQI